MQAAASTEHRKPENPDRFITYRRSVLLIRRDGSNLGSSLALTNYFMADGNALYDALLILYPGLLRPATLFTSIRPSNRGRAGQGEKSAPPNLNPTCHTDPFYRGHSHTLRTIFVHEIKLNHAGTYQSGI